MQTYAPLPFSRRGSYLVFNRIDGTFLRTSRKEGLYLRTVHGDARDSFVASLSLLRGDQTVEFDTDLSPECLALTERRHPLSAPDPDQNLIRNPAQGPVSDPVPDSAPDLPQDSIRDPNPEPSQDLPRNPAPEQTQDPVRIEIVFADTRTILIRGTGPAAGLRLDFLMEETWYNSLQPLPSGGCPRWHATCYKNNLHLMLSLPRGCLQLDQSWNGHHAQYCRCDVQAQGGEFLLILEEMDPEWTGPRLIPEVDAVKKEVRKEFGDFCARMPLVPAEYGELRRLAAYIDWSSIVAARGILRRDAMYMSKNWMCGVWSWDHCFNALALADGDPGLAWDQFMLMFDYQEETGRIPDVVNDVSCNRVFCKPPIHGWTLRRLRRKLILTRAMREEAYERLARWTLWWLNFRDADGDGLCEYTHGNDCGWDNSTLFRALPPLTLPDLAAFLILQMDELSVLAGELGRGADAALWTARADDMLSRMLEKLFEDHLPVGVRTATGERIESESLLLYLPIVLGQRLPQAERDAILGVLQSGKYLTEFGLSTEPVTSPFYEPDGYWRGPIWAAPTLLILDGLQQCGETAFAKDLASRFCGMALRSGFAENYNALTGEGLRDRAFTWTASSTLVMAREFLMEG